MGEFQTMDGNKKPLHNHGEQPGDSEDEDLGEGVDAGSDPSRPEELTPGRLADLEAHRRALARFGNRMPSTGCKGVGIASREPSRIIEVFHSRHKCKGGPRGN